jgi:predicted transcriptional regulator
MKLATRTVKIIDHEKTGAAIRKRREKYGIEQKKLADDMGISRAYLSYLEAGKRQWDESLFDRAVYCLTCNP